MCTHAYILYFNDLVWGVLVGPHWASLHENMPLGPFFDDEKKIYMSAQNERGPVEWVEDQLSGFGCPGVM